MKPYTKGRAEFIHYTQARWYVNNTPSPPGRNAMQRRKKRGRGRGYYENAIGRCIIRRFVDVVGCARDHSNEQTSLLFSFLFLFY